MFIAASIPSPRYPGTDITTGTCWCPRRCSTLIAFIAWADAHRHTCGWAQRLRSASNIAVVGVVGHRPGMHPVRDRRHGPNVVGRHSDLFLLGRSELSALSRHAETVRRDHRARSWGSRHPEHVKIRSSPGRTGTWWASLTSTRSRIHVICVMRAEWARSTMGRPANTATPVAGRLASRLRPGDLVGRQWRRRVSRLWTIRNSCADWPSTTPGLPRTGRKGSVSSHESSIRRPWLSSASRRWSRSVAQFRPTGLTPTPR